MYTFPNIIKLPLNNSVPERPGDFLPCFVNVDNVLNVGSVETTKGDIVIPTNLQITYRKSASASISSNLYSFISTIIEYGNYVGSIDQFKLESERFKKLIKTSSARPNSALLFNLLPVFLGGKSQVPVNSNFVTDIYTRAWTEDITL